VPAKNRQRTINFRGEEDEYPAPPNIAQPQEFFIAPLGRASKDIRNAARSGPAAQIETATDLEENTVRKPAHWSNSDHLVPWAPREVEIGH
jgi:hypothetical protein